jgi:hypothetical protein
MVIGREHRRLCASLVRIMPSTMSRSSCGRLSWPSSAAGLSDQTFSGQDCLTGPHPATRGYATTGRGEWLFPTRPPATPDGSGGDHGGPAFGRRRSDPGVFGTTPPPPPEYTVGFGGGVFYSIPWASLRLSQHPSPRPNRAIEITRGAAGASGTGRTIGQAHRHSSNGIPPCRPGGFHNLPGQGITGFPAVDIDARRSSARRSDSRRSRSSDP